MTNEVKKPDITQEQIDFILNDMRNKGLSTYGIPTKAEEGLTAEAWLKQAHAIVTPPHITLKSQSSQYLTSITPFILNNFSEMSEDEKINFIKDLPDIDSEYMAYSFKRMNEIRKVSPENADLFFNAMMNVNHSSRAIVTYSNYPATPKPEPEPVVEKPNWFETSSKDHQVRVEQWMEHIGMKDQAKALIDKYGLPVAYEVVQTSMQAPADMTKATDGKFKNSKDTIKYFLDNDVTAEKLETIPDLDAETIKASLDSVKKPEPVVRPKPVQAVSIDLPTNAVSMPSAPVLSQLDTQKAHYAALIGENLKLDGIDAADIKAASEAALRATLPNKSDTLDEWSAGFRYNLSKALGLQETAKNTKHYQDRANVLIAASKDAVEAATSGEPSAELAEQVAAYTSIVNRHNLKGDLAGMSGTETLNPETYFKDRQVQKQLLARAEKRAEREERKAERKANRQENVDTMKDWFKKAKSLVD